MTAAYIALTIGVGLVALAVPLIFAASCPAVEGRTANRLGYSGLAALSIGCVLCAVAGMILGGIAHGYL